MTAIRRRARRRMGESSRIVGQRGATGEGFFESAPKPLGSAAETAMPANIVLSMKILVHSSGLKFCLFAMTRAVDLVRLSAHGLVLEIRPCRARSQLPADARRRSVGKVRRVGALQVPRPLAGPQRWVRCYLGKRNCNPKQFVLILCQA